jgi:hypothetical protein
MSSSIQSEVLVYLSTTSAIIPTLHEGLRTTMSGAEAIAVLGVVASAAQLVDYSLKVIGAISDIYDRVKGAPNRVARYTTQIYQITETGRAIQENQNLQNPLIHSQLRSTLAEVEHLHKVLSIIRLDYTTGSGTKRVWKAIVGDKERRMLTCFKRLEKEKLALILCITVVQAQHQQTIGSGVELLVEREMPGFGISELIEKYNDKSKNSKVSQKSFVRCKIFTES